MSSDHFFLQIPKRISLPRVSYLERIQRTYCSTSLRSFVSWYDRGQSFFSKSCVRYIFHMCVQFTAVPLSLIHIWSSSTLRFIIFYPNFLHHLRLQGLCCLLHSPPQTFGCNSRTSCQSPYFAHPVQVTKQLALIVSTIHNMSTPPRLLITSFLTSIKSWKSTISLPRWKYYYSFLENV